MACTRLSMTGLLAILSLYAAVAVPGANAAEYKGLCEASAGAFLDDTHFAVASDETNVLQIYQRGNPNPVNNADLVDFTFDKSDLEGAARIGDRIYWISSHSFNSEGKDRAKRQVFFATTIGTANGKPTLTPAGKLNTTLRDAIVAAAGAGVEKGTLNIEALAATPEGGLLIGLRGPLRNSDAIVIPFKNPAAVIDQQAKPEFGETLTLKLDNRGLRSMDLIGTGEKKYFIIAGPVSDGPGFALFTWAGPGGSAPVLLTKNVDLTGLTPEGAMAVPGQNLVQLLSDDGKVDGKKCDDEKDPPEMRQFRSIDVKP